LLPGEWGNPVANPRNPVHTVRTSAADSSAGA